MSDKVTQSELVKELKKAYVEELLSLQNYLSIGNYLEGVDGEYIGDSLVGDVDEEKSHAERLAQRLTELDARPVLSSEVSDLEGVSQDIMLSVDNEGSVRDAVEAVIELESGAVKRYKRIIRYARELGDETTRTLAEDLLADEEEHLDEFEGYKNQM